MEMAHTIVCASSAPVNSDYGNNCLLFLSTGAHFEGRFYLTDVFNRTKIRQPKKKRVPSMAPGEIDLSSSDRIRVVVRCRPKKESEQGTTFVECIDDKRLSLQTAPDRPQKEFGFDYVAGDSSTQELIYEQAGRPVVDCILAGFHGTIFAYGQTGTGKTWSTSGPPGAKSSDVPDCRGVIPRACEAIFDHIAATSSESLTFKVRASYLEIYNEKIKDLLADSKKAAAAIKAGGRASKGIFLRETASGEVLVEGGRQWTSVSSEVECVAVLAAGVVNRSVGATAMNSESSRSHAIFTIEVSQTSTETMKQRISQLHLVDLAGSERLKSTHATGDRLKESNEINKSLTSLGNVIQALVDAAGKSGKRHIPYRDSKLTFLLKDALGGNSKTCLIATISPAESSLSETASTLEFAKRCSAIKNTATINENLTNDVKELQDEVRRLRTLVHDLEDSGQISAGLAKKLSVKRPRALFTVVPLPAGAVDVDSTIDAARDARNTSESHRRHEENARAERLQLITADALAREETVKINLQATESRCCELQKLVGRQEKTAAALRSVVELRDGELQELRDGSWTRDSGVRRLRREIELIKIQRDNHPELNRLSIELLESRAEVRSNATDEENRRFEEQLNILTRELEAALVENGALRELATPRGGKAQVSPFASQKPGQENQRRQHTGASGASARSIVLLPKPAYITPNGIGKSESGNQIKKNAADLVRKASNRRGDKLKDLLSTLRASVHNLEESITTATNSTPSVTSPMSPMTPMAPVNF